MLKTIDPAKNAISTIKRLIATGDDIIIYRLVLVPSLAILVDISHILGNLITVIFDYQILRKPLKILSL